MQITQETIDDILSEHVVVLAHAPCIDGFCSVLLFKAYTDWLQEKTNKPINVDFHPADHASKMETLPDIKGKVVFIFDFSYPRAVLQDMKKQAKRLVVLDHHVSAQKQLQGLDFCHFDMTKSGAKLVADYLNVSEFQAEIGMPSLSTIADYVSDRDLWTFTLPESAIVNVAIGSWPYRFFTSQQLAQALAVWTSYAELPIKKFMPKVIYEGEIVNRQLSKIKADCIDFSYLGQLIGRTELVPIVNTVPHVASETLNEVLQNTDYPYSVSWFFNGSKYVYSLRSIDDFDVSKVAAQYGGGGHKNAAGFSAFDPMIDTFEQSSRRDMRLKRRRLFFS